MKLFNIALSSAFLVTCTLVFASITPAIAAEVTTQETSTYQSSFDDYKPLADDNLANRGKINTETNGSGNTVHSMQGTQHQMTAEQMANMPSEKELSDQKEIPAMEGMNHGDMKTMDHTQMKQKQEAAPMERMDPANMSGMDHGEVKMTPSNTKPASLPMDHAQMQGMSKDKPGQSNKQSIPEMGRMDHSKMTANEQNHKESLAAKPAHDEMTAHDDVNRKSMDHSGMAMPPTQPVNKEKQQNQFFQIIPNVHPMVVHFPIALTLVAFVLSLAAHVRRSHPIAAQLAAAGHYTLWLAAFGALAAVVFGWLAFNSVNHDDAGHAAMLLHRAWAVPTAFGVIFLASWDAWKHRVNNLMPIPALILLLVLSSTITITGWLGGEVVYRHGIGVLSLPSSEISEHSKHHEHSGKAALEHAHGMAESNSDEPIEHHPKDEKGESHEH